MKKRSGFLMLYLVFVCILNNCAPTAPIVPVDNKPPEPADSNVKHVTLVTGDVITLECPKDKTVPNAYYIGTYVGVENNMDLKHIAQDFYCAERFKEENFPNGFVTIYGSASIPVSQPPCSLVSTPVPSNPGEPTRNPCTPIPNSENSYDADCAARIKANCQIAALIRGFAYDWTKDYGDKYPILTGAGPGLMEKGSQGAMDAIQEEINKTGCEISKRRSIGYTTYYDRPNPFPTPCDKISKPYLGDATHAFPAPKGQQIITDGLIFSSVAMREYFMIKHSAAIVIAPGGTGTEWEIFQIVETMKSYQLKPVPIYLIGDFQTHWESLYSRLREMKENATVKVEFTGDNIIKFTNSCVTIEYVPDKSLLIKKLKETLHL